MTLLETATAPLVTGPSAAKHPLAQRRTEASLTAPAGFSWDLAALPPDIAARISPSPLTGCWIGQGTPDSGGYIRYRNTRLHRAVWIALFGPIPGLVIDHVAAECGDTRCCLPGHTEAITQRENVLRGQSPAAINARKVNCDRDHLLSGPNLYTRPNGWRTCRECVRISRREAATHGLRLAA